MNVLSVRTAASCMPVPAGEDSESQGGHPVEQISRADCSVLQNEQDSLQQSELESKNFSQAVISQ